MIAIVITKLSVLKIGKKLRYVTVRLVQNSTNLNFIGEAFFKVDMCQRCKSDADEVIISLTNFALTTSQSDLLVQ